jgi:hypothetical protein
MKRSNMNRTTGLLALLVLFGGTEAMAQSGNNNRGSLSTGQTINGGIPDAPIGHRQPRPGDVPDEKNLANPNDPINKEDAALDKKIKSICRGC